MQPRSQCTPLRRFQRQHGLDHRLDVRNRQCWKPELSHAFGRPQGGQRLAALARCLVDGEQQHHATRQARRQGAQETLCRRVGFMGVIQHRENGLLIADRCERLPHRIAERRIVANGRGEKPELRGQRRNDASHLGQRFGCGARGTFGFSETLEQLSRCGVVVWCARTRSATLIVAAIAS